MKQLNIVIKKDAVYYKDSTNQIYKYTIKAGLVRINRMQYVKIPTRTAQLDSEQWLLLAKFKKLFVGMDTVLYFRMKDNFNI